MLVTRCSNPMLTRSCSSLQLSGSFFGRKTQDKSEHTTPAGLTGRLEAIPMKFLTNAKTTRAVMHGCDGLACTALLVAFLTCLFSLTPAAYGQASSSSTRRAR